MTVSIELEWRKMKEVFRLLRPRGQDVPLTELIPNAACHVETPLLILGFLQWSMCPLAITRDLMEKLGTAGLDRDNCTIDSIVFDIKTKKAFQDVLVEWAYFWTMNFLIPLMEVGPPPNGGSVTERENALAIEIISRDYFRCAVTDAYDVIAAPNDVDGPFASLVCTRIIPSHLGTDTLVKHLVRVYSGGRVDLASGVLDEPSNCLILSESIVGSFKNFHWSLKPTETGIGNPSSFEYFVDPVATRQVRDIAQLPRPKRLDIGYEPEGSSQTLNPDLCLLHASICRILKTSRATATLVRFHRVAPELGPWRRPGVIDDTDDTHSAEYGNCDSVPIGLLTGKLSRLKAKEDEGSSLNGNSTPKDI